MAADTFPRLAVYEPAGRLLADRPRGRGQHRAPRRRSPAWRVLAILVLLASMAAGIALAAMPGPAHASTATPGYAALKWAETRAGAWYGWGGTGPAYDCSGLVYEAYLHQGVNVGRDTFDMLASGRLVRIPLRDARQGDLMFYGPGHVELKTLHGTFGALEPGTRVGWHRWNAWWHPTMAFRVR